LRDARENFAEGEARENNTAAAKVANLYLWPICTFGSGMRWDGAMGTLNSFRASTCAYARKERSRGAAGASLMLYFSLEWKVCARHGAGSVSVILAKLLSC